MQRREFLKTAAAGAALFSHGPLILGAEDKAGTRTPVIGTGEHRYECHHNWGELPADYAWQTTHNVAVDEAGQVYITHQGIGKKMDTILVFDPKGKFIRSFGKEFHGGGHGIEVRKEGGEEFLYLTNTWTPTLKVLKTTLTGQTVWQKGRPEIKEYENPKAGYSPTNVAFCPDGSFFIADGYGSHYIMKYDKDGKLLKTFSGRGTDLGKCQTPHGLWVDARDPSKPVLVVCDRANFRLQWFDLDGNVLKASKPKEMVLFPAHADTRGDVLLLPDLHARVSLFDKENKPIVHLGEDAAWRAKVLDGMKVRTQPSMWVAGKFIHPHDACFDKDGNIFVVEWVSTGRVTFLKKVT